MAKMQQRLRLMIVFAGIGVVAVMFMALPVHAGQLREVTDESLPADVHPDSRSRLPALRRADLDERGQAVYDAAVRAAGTGAGDVALGAGILRLHGSGADVRWVSPLGRALTELAILITAREHDQPYEWSLHEMEAVAVGLDPAVIDIVRHRRPLSGVEPKASVIIEIGRELFGEHRLSADTYARALEQLGETNLVDVVDLMGRYAGTAARLTAVNQQMPPGWTQFLPLPFTPPDDIHADSRSRLPLKRREGQPAVPSSPPELYSRTLAPEGTGPGHIRRHAAGLPSLEANVGPRLIGLAILVTARAYDSQYDWTTSEIEAREDGLEPEVIAVVRDRRPTTGLGEPEAALIRFGRELFGDHTVSAATYARAVGAFGETNLVDLVSVMADHAAVAALLAAFDQRLPAGQPPRLPIP